MGAGNNFGLKFVKTKYALILNPDIICGNDFFLNLKIYLDGNINFSLIGTLYNIHTNYKPAGFFNNLDRDIALTLKERAIKTNQRQKRHLV